VSFSSRGIVLSKEFFGEADSYVQFFTKEWGMISVLAKSARKSRRRYVGGLDLFCHDEIFIRGDVKERPYLQELTVLNAFTGLRDKLERAWTAGRMVQWVRKLADVATPMPGVYSLLGQTLALAEKENSDERLELLALVFKLKLLAQIGLKPKVDVCARCESALRGNNFFNLEAGGILCDLCSKGVGHQDFLPIDNDGRLMLDLADRFKLPNWEMLEFSAPKTANLTQLVTRFATFHTQTKLPH
jgi:DNA repair protein RecO (recombination protein O)